MNKYDFDRELERAVFFLVQAMEPVKEKHRKPVALHSIRVALSLYDYGQLDLVVAAALHDLVEDADVALEEIEREFGASVAQLVAANTYDKAIPERAKRNLEMLHRCKANGKKALLIKAADILDNSYYYPLRQPAEHVAYLLEKMKYFIELSSAELREEAVWESLNRQYQRLVERHHEANAHRDAFNA